MSIIYNDRGNTVPDVATFKVTGVAAITAGTLPIAPTGNFRILNITGHAASSVTETLTIGLDSKEGAVYDTNLRTVAAGWTDFFYEGELSDVFEFGDKIVIACTNAAIVKSVIVRIEYL